MELQPLWREIPRIEYLKLTSQLDTYNELFIGRL